MKTIVLTILVSVSLFSSCSYRYTQRELQDIEVTRFIIPYAEQNDFEIVAYTSPDVLNWSLPGFLLNSHKKLELQEARQLVKHLYTDMMSSIKKSNEDQTKNKANKNYVSMRPVNISPEELSFRLDFWDSECNRYPKPYISQISFRQGTVYFYEVDDVTRKLVPIASESIKDLMSQVENS